MGDTAAGADAEERPYLPFERRLDHVQGMLRAYLPMVSARYLLGMIMGDGTFQIRPDDDEAPLLAMSEIRFSAKLEGRMLLDSIRRVGDEMRPEMQQAMMEALEGMQTIALLDRELDRAILLWDRDIGDVVDELYKGTEQAS